MIILISPENDVPKEMEVLLQLFEEGLYYYHLRKPNKNYDQHCDYLNLIPKKYHDRIVVHDFHELINIYHLKGIHFQEQKRKDHLDYLDQYFKPLRRSGKTISSSFHEIEELESCPFEFDYHLLSPVFTSISKKNYQGREFNVKQIDKRIIGMGGVSINNLTQFESLGYHGVGILGGIWKHKEPVNAFKALINEYSKNDFKK